MLFFPFRYKAPLAFPQMFSLFLYSYTILSDSLSLFGFKGLSGPIVTTAWSVLRLLMEEASKYGGYQRIY
jgi:hypothetical protein